MIPPVPVVLLVDPDHELRENDHLTNYSITTSSVSLQVPRLGYGEKIGGIHGACIKDDNKVCNCWMTPTGVPKFMGSPVSRAKFRKLPNVSRAKNITWEVATAMKRLRAGTD